MTATHKNIPRIYVCHIKLTFKCVRNGQMIDTRYQSAIRWPHYTRHIFLSSIFEICDLLKISHKIIVPIIRYPDAVLVIFTVKYFEYFLNFMRFRHVKTYPHIQASGKLRFFLVNKYGYIDQYVSFDKFTVLEWLITVWGSVLWQKFCRKTN